MTTARIAPSTDSKEARRAQLSARAKRLEATIDALARRTPSEGPRPRPKALAIAEFRADLRAVRAALRRAR